MSAKADPLRVAIDLGSVTTRILAGSNDPAELRTLPTVFAQGSSAEAYIIGETALKRGPEAKPVFPFRRGFAESERHGLIYLRLLRQLISATAQETWAVFSAPASSREDEPEKLARLAGKVFDRVLIIPGITLATIAMREHPSHHAEGAVIVDMGAVSLQAALLDPERSEPREITHFAGGGITQDARLETELRALLADLHIPSVTTRKLKERYARFTNGPGPCLVQIIHQSHRRVLDIGGALFASAQNVLVSLTEAIATVLGGESDERALTYGTEVILIGGGALQSGIGEALLDALRSRGYPTRQVTIPPNPHELIVRGAWRIARMLTPEHWDVLV